MHGGGDVSVTSKAGAMLPAQRAAILIQHRAARKARNQRNAKTSLDRPCVYTVGAFQPVRRMSTRTLTGQRSQCSLHNIKLKLPTGTNLDVVP